MTVAVVRRRRSRVLGLGLIAYGLIGLLIVVVVLTGLLRVLDRVESLSSSFETQRRSLTTALDTASSTVRSTATTVSGVNGSLTQAETSVRNAATLATDVSGTMANLATSLNVDILGSQPFAGASAGFSTAAVELQTLSAGLGETATALRTNGTDAEAVGRQLIQLQAAVDAVRDGLKATPDTRISGGDVGMLRLVVAALLAWLAVQAVAAVFAGLWLAGGTMRGTRAAGQAASHSS